MTLWTMRNARRLLATVCLCTAAAACGNSDAPLTAPVAASVQITVAKATLEVGESSAFTAEALDARGSPFPDIVWSATPASIIAVSESGVVTAIGQGTGVVSASAGTQRATVSVSVLRGTVTQVTIAGVQGPLSAGTTTALTAVSKDARGTTLSGRATVWSSSEPTVVSIDQAGMARAIVPGSATLSATVEGQSTSVTVAVVPGTVSSVTLSPSQATIAVGESLSVHFQARDTIGNVTTIPPPTWTSSSPSVASVSTSGVVTALSPGSTSITATSGSSSAVALILVNAVTSDRFFFGTTTLDGRYRYQSVTLPVGATLQAGREVRIESEGDITLDGDINGNCSAITLVSKGRIVLRGRIENPCPAARTVSEAGSLRVIAAGGYTLGSRVGGVSSMRIRTAGHQRYTNDSTLTDAQFAAGAARNMTSASCTLDVASVQSPGGARNGNAGQFGEHGADAGNILIECAGTLHLRGHVAIASQAAGSGGNATHTANGNAIAIAGNGGRYGTIRLRATGDVLSGPSLVSGEAPTISLTVGGSGRGGNAVATSQSAPIGAGSATAIGGNGGDGGFVGASGESLLVRANGQVILPPGINPNNFELQVFPSGAGGTAVAQAADGQAAGDLPAQSGGDALARGGRAGRMHAATISFGEGAVDLRYVFVLGGGIGTAGTANATAGRGGDGNATFRDGAPGGAAFAFGGDGSDNGFLFGGLTSRPVDAGVGGAARIAGGSGGIGHSSCAATGGSAGRGGRGGDGAGRGGRGGTNAAGAAMLSALTVDGAGNGGRGGGGATPGAGGAPGADNTSASDQRVNVGAVFTQGPVGSACPQSP